MLGLGLGDDLMFYEIARDTQGGLMIGARYVERSASKLGVEEKTIEDWLAVRPELLFPRERILVIAQSIAGQGMADILALDGQGNLVVVEIKRDWSDRIAVAQLLSYAADLRRVTYERLNSEAQRYSKWAGGELIMEFRKFIDDVTFPPEKLAQRQRIFIVAPSSDAELRKIVEWLQDYKAPIQFIPFSLIADDGGSPRFISIEGIEADPEASQTSEDEWAGHWIFNTNETNNPGAYKAMFDRSVIAIYGYDNGPRNLEGSSKGDKVFAYVNGQGIRALGLIEDPTVQDGKGIFLDKNGNQGPGEYHVAVKWLCLLEQNQAFTNQQATALGYSLPVRTVFGRLKRGRLANQIEQELRRRASA
jgi:hypothetical protein